MSSPITEPRRSEVPAPRIGRYEVLQELGHGAMSTVYLARDSVIGRLVALKTFRGVSAGGETLDQLRRRLLREAQSAGRLSHPNVVTVFDVVEGDEEGNSYIAMEYVRGVNLEERLRWEKALAVPEVVEIIAQIASALDHFHARGVIHRDIKPANVLLTDGGGLKIADFGIAWQAGPAETQDLTILGTPQYMAPEQIQGRPVDGRSDVFSLGVLLYEMLTRRKPFPGKTVSEVTHHILHAEAIPPEVAAPELPTELAAVVRRAISKDPEARYASGGALLQDLCGAAGLPGPRAQVDPNAPTHALPPGIGADAAPARGAGKRRRLRLPVPGRLVTTGAALALGLFLGWWLLGRQAPEPTGPSELPTSEVILEEGKALLPADPEAASVLFGLAERLAADPEPARELKAEAERRVAERGAERRFEEASRAVAERRFGDAVASTRELLGSETGHERAIALLGDLEKALAAPARGGSRGPPASGPAPARSRARPLERVPDAETPQPVVDPAGFEPAPRSAAAPETAGLEIDLASETPRGVLTLYADERQVYRRAFNFFRRKYWVLREPTAGELSERIEVPAGSFALRVLVARHDEASQVVTLPVSLERGQVRRLEVTLPASGEAAVTLR